MISSRGLYGDTSPVPSSFRPQVSKVDGRNWAMPSAPEPALRAFGSQSDSTWSCAAMIGGVMAAHSDPDLRTHATYADGTAEVFSPPLPEDWARGTGCAASVSSRMNPNTA